MPVNATITRSTYTAADAITPAMFNGQSSLAVTVPDAGSGTEGVIRLAGDLTGPANAPVLAASGVTAGTYANADDNVPQLTVDAKGRITAIANRPLVLPATGVIGGSYASAALNVPQLDVDTKGRITAIANRDIATLILDHVRAALFPVGEILITHRTGNPATWLGFGTWSPYAEGRTLVGLDQRSPGSADPDFDAIDDSGGTKTHTLMEQNLAEHTHAAGALSGTTTSNGTHQHFSFNDVVAGDNRVTASLYPAAQTSYNGDNRYEIQSTPLEADVGRTSSAGAHTHDLTITGSTATAGTAQPVNHMPPFVTIAVWLRTA